MLEPHKLVGAQPKVGGGERLVEVRLGARAYGRQHVFGLVEHVGQSDRRRGGAELLGQGGRVCAALPVGGAVPARGVAVIRSESATLCAIRD